MISIQTNVNSLMAQENLRVNNTFQSQTINRLTSGFRINSSGDDAAGLAIANRYRSQVAQLSQGVRNANDGVSVLQNIDGGLNNIGQILTRMQTIASEGATGTATSSGGTDLNAEFASLKKEIDRQAASVGIGSTTDLGTQYVAQIDIFVGGGSASATATTDAQVSFTIGAADSAGLSLSGTVDTTTNAIAALDKINTAIDNLGTKQGKVGAALNQLQYAVQLANTEIADYSAADARIRDADVAAEAANLTKSQVLEQASIAAMAQANSAPQAILKLLA